MRELLPNKGTLPSQNSETTEIVNRTTNLIRAGRGLKPTARIKTPIAVTW